MFQRYPDLLAQSVYAAFCHAFPTSYRQFDDRFKDDLIFLVYQWITGNYDQSFHDNEYIYKWISKIAIWWIKSLISRLLTQTINYSFLFSIICFISWWLNRINHLINKLINQLNNEWSIQWLINWLIDWLIVAFFLHFRDTSSTENIWKMEFFQTWANWHAKRRSTIFGWFSKL